MQKKLTLLATTTNLKNLLWFCGFFLLIGQTACKSSKNNNQPAKQASLLWEISGKGIQKSYLYGTVHLANPKVIALSENTLDEIAACEVMAGELVLDEKNLMASMGTMLTHLFMKDTTLEMLLSAEEYEWVEKKAKEKMGMMAPALLKMKPLFISVLLSEEGGLQGGGLKGGFGGGGFGGGSSDSKKEPVDMFLQRKAKELNKEVVGLETIDEQMLAFNSLSLKEQAKMLSQMIKEGENKGGKMDYEALLAVYYTQDIDSLFTLTQGSLSSFSNQSLLVKRNQNMADRMEKIMQSKKLFTAVGAAHLAGETGVIALLRKKGYKVRAKKL